MISLKFVPFQAHIAAEFWQLLSQKKIDEAKLSDDDLRILATYTTSASKVPSMSARLDLNQQAFRVTESVVQDEYIARGIVRNTNTLEDFKALDKNEFLNELARVLMEDITSGAAEAEPSLLVTFALLSFADLKRYTYFYWMVYPVLPTTWHCDSAAALKVREMERLDQSISAWRRTSESTQWGFFVYHLDTHETFLLGEWQQVPRDSRAFGFIDPSNSGMSLGWPARNLLALIFFKFHLTKINLLSVRSAKAAMLFKNCEIDSSMLGADGQPPKPTGWERNNAGKLAPRFVNLGSVMDPAKLADDAVDLNLKLMKWRIAPELDLSGIKDCKCLLLGAGTLGCYVSRLLLGWGVQKITLIDSGKVSFSNPVRQPLFRFEDCLESGKDKAEAAAQALREVYPGVNTKGHKLSVPMIGHPFLSVKDGEEDYHRLESLIDSHDAVFLLMDSRESRWLPTIMCAAKSKLAINAALGFDSYVVMRHGVPLSEATDEVATPISGESRQLGCYFCNDVVAPTDSTSDRSLDQQCTVTRPGLAALASATAVELLVSILQHPLKAECPAPKASDSTTDSSSSDRHHSDTRNQAETVLGSVPHTVRGYLRSWSTKVLHGHAYPNCSACGSAVVEAFRQGGWDFVRQAVNEAGFVERLAGLKEVQDGIEGINVDWDSEEEDEDV